MPDPGADPEADPRTDPGVGPGWSLAGGMTSAAGSSCPLDRNHSNGVSGFKVMREPGTSTGMEEAKSEPFWAPPLVSWNRQVFSVLHWYR